MLQWTSFLAKLRALLAAPIELQLLSALVNMSKALDCDTGVFRLFHVALSPQGVLRRRTNRCSICILRITWIP